MALNKAQLEALNNANFADNTSGDITPADLRQFNSASIDAYALEAELTSVSASFATTISTITGSQGPQGATGPAGPSGSAGPVGPTGASGSIGPQGPAGQTGPSGSAGPQGAQGPTGPAGSGGVASGSLNTFATPFTDLTKISGYAQDAFWISSQPTNGGFGIDTALIDSNNNRMFLSPMYVESGSIVNQVAIPYSYVDAGSGSITWFIYDVNSAKLPNNLVASGSITATVPSSLGAAIASSSAALNIGLSKSTYWAGLMVNDVSKLKGCGYASTSYITSNIVFPNYPNGPASPIGFLFYDAGTFAAPLSLSGSSFGHRSDQATAFLYK